MSLPTHTTIDENGNQSIQYTIKLKTEKKWWQFWKKDEAKESLGKLIHDYREKINWDDEEGTLTINGTQSLLPFKKEMWFPSPQ